MDIDKSCIFTNFEKTKSSLRSSVHVILFYIICHLPFANCSYNYYNYWKNNGHWALTISAIKNMHLMARKSVRRPLIPSEFYSMLLFSVLAINWRLQAEHIPFYSVSLLYSSGGNLVNYRTHSYYIHNVLWCTLSQRSSGFNLT